MVQGQKVKLKNMGELSEISLVWTNLGGSRVKITTCYKCGWHSKSWFGRTLPRPCGLRKKFSKDIMFFFSFCQIVILNLSLFAHWMGNPLFPHTLKKMPKMVEKEMPIILGCTYGKCINVWCLCSREWRAHWRVTENLRVASGARFW